MCVGRIALLVYGSPERGRGSGTDVHSEAEMCVFKSPVTGAAKWRFWDAALGCGWAVSPCLLLNGLFELLLKKKKQVLIISFLSSFCNGGSPHTSSRTEGSHSLA